MGLLQEPFISGADILIGRAVANIPDAERGFLLLLRPHQPEDSEAMHAAVTESLPAVSPWLQWSHAGYSREETDSFIKLAGEAWAYDIHYPFAILAVADGAFLGGTGINHIVKPNRLANVGNWVRTSRTRRGIACAACSAKHGCAGVRIRRFPAAEQFQG